MKKIFYLLLTILCLFFIYNYFNKKSINYVLISDSIDSNNLYDSYIKKYLCNKNGSVNDNFRQKKIIDLIKDIKKNRTIWNNNDEIYLKKVLRESDVLILNVGMNELNELYNPYRMELNYYYFNNLYLLIAELVREITKYAKEKIIFIGYYNPTEYYDGKTDEFFYYVNLKLNRLMINNNISYINVYTMFKEQRYKNNEIINEKGAKSLANIIEFYL